jgi:hypothetical protein
MPWARFGTWAWSSELQGLGLGASCFLEPGARSPEPGARSSPPKVTPKAEKAHHPPSAMRPFAIRHPTQGQGRCRAPPAPACPPCAASCRGGWASARGQGVGGVPQSPLPDLRTSHSHLAPVARCPPPPPPGPMCEKSRFQDVKPTLLHIPRPSQTVGEPGAACGVSELPGHGCCS